MNEFDNYNVIKYQIFFFDTRNSFLTIYNKEKFTKNV